MSCQKEGFVLVFTALVMPIILLVGALVLDSGAILVRHASLSYTASEAGNSALFRLSEIIAEEAQDQKDILCDSSLPSLPPECSSREVLDFLEWSDIQSLTLSVDTQVALSNEVSNFISQFGPDPLIDTSQVYLAPLEINESQNKITLNIVIKEFPQTWFANLLPPQEIVASQKSKLIIK